MKKIILAVVLVSTLTVGAQTKVLAGGDLDGDATIRDVSEAIANTTYEIIQKQGRVLNINWDAVLNAFAELFACVEDHGNDVCSLKYCKCLSHIDDNLSSIEQTFEKSHCIVVFNGCRREVVSTQIK